MHSPFLKRCVKWLCADSIIFLLSLCLTLTVYGYFIFVPPDYTGVTHYTQYLGEGFLSGHTYTSIFAAPELAQMEDPYDVGANAAFRFHDASYYKGKYYLYFGPVPALLIWVPVKFLSGVELTDEELALILAAMGTTALFLLLYSIVRTISFNSLRLRYFALLQVFLVLGLGTWVPFLLRRAHFYEVAIIGAYGFTAMGLYCLWRWLNRRQAYVWLGLASLCFGLAIGCRIIHVFNGIFLLLALLYVWRQSKHWKDVVPPFIWAAVPMGLCLVSLAIYNYVRFDSPFETGWHYQLGVYSQHSPDFRVYTPEDVPHALYRYFINPVGWPATMTPPFFDLKDYWKGYEYFDAEPALGVFTNTPFILLFAGIFFRSLRQRISPEAKLVAYGLLLYCIPIITMLSMFFFTTQRYTLDFAPWLMLCAELCYLYLLQAAQGSKWLMRVSAMGAMLALYSVFIVTMTAPCGLILNCMHTMLPGL